MLFPNFYVASVVLKIVVSELGSRNRVPERVYRILAACEAFWDKFMGSSYRSLTWALFFQKFPPRSPAAISAA
jgi:hypothetical protein